MNCGRSRQGFYFMRVEGEQAYLVVVNLSSQEQDLPLINGVGRGSHCQYQVLESGVGPDAFKVKLA